MKGFLTILTGRNLPLIRQPRAGEPSTINEKGDRGLHAGGRGDGDFGGAHMKRGRQLRWPYCYRLSPIRFYIQCPSTWVRQRSRFINLG